MAGAAGVVFRIMLGGSVLLRVGRSRLRLRRGFDRDGGLGLCYRGATVELSLNDLNELLLQRHAEEPVAPGHPLAELDRVVALVDVERFSTSTARQIEIKRKEDAATLRARAGETRAEMLEERLFCRSSRGRVGGGIVIQRETGNGVGGFLTGPQFQQGLPTLGHGHGQRI